MEQRISDKTGFTVTRFGIGLAALGRPGYINLGHAQDLNQTYAVSVMEQHSHQVLDAAWAAGIRYFDVARSYGKAEQFLSSWLLTRQIPPSKVVVASKWGYTYTAEWQITAEKHEVKDHSLPVLQRQMQESLELLGNYLRLYQIHSATLESGVLEDSDVLAELGRLRDGGLHIGLSLSGPAQAQTLHRAMQVQVGNKPLFSAVQATWNLLERSAGDVLQKAHESGMLVIVKEALANGRLTSRNLDPQLAILQKTADFHHTSIDALALAAVLAQPWADVVLSGAATSNQLESNLQALQVEWNEETAEKLAYLAETPAHYWHIRSQLAWN